MRSRRLAAVGLAALALGSGAAAGPGAVTAAAYASAGSGAGAAGGCGAFPGARQLPGADGIVPAAWSGGGLLVPACGPVPGGGGTARPVHPYPGALWTAGYQCVEFSERYLYQRFGVTMDVVTNGDQVAANYAARYPGLFMVIRNGTPHRAPAAGDVLSLSAAGTLYGTVSTVTASSGTVSAETGDGTLAGRPPTALVTVAVTDTRGATATAAIALPLPRPRGSPADRAPANRELADRASANQALADRVLAGTPRMTWPAAGR